MYNIDFVLTWVDGNDPDWQAKQQAHLPETAKNDVDNSIARFRNWGTLKYWFRGVEKYAPWVHKIHFVTDHQIPSWLNIQHPKLHIVNHEDYIDQKFLPTFNSHVIENNMHKIPELSESFVYFNDDVFLTQKTSPKDFFSKNLPKDVGIMAPIQQPNTQNIGGVMINNAGIINENFTKNHQIKKSPLRWFNPKYGVQNIRSLCSLPWSSFVGFYAPHIAIGFHKSTFYEVWSKYHYQLEQTNTHKFRDNHNDISPWLFRDWQIASNHFQPRSIRFGTYFDLSKEFDQAITAIRQQKYKITCVNDSNYINDFETKRHILLNAFQEILPAKSEFEK